MQVIPDRLNRQTMFGSLASTVRAGPNPLLGNSSSMAVFNQSRTSQMSSSLTTTGPGFDNMKRVAGAIRHCPHVMNAGS